ncbi:Crp/Fnr family transcriptional regulator [Candidatus Soleaferrea massiliensis]|uniref:Crp/Fnr family transcriptional regulator n=1 Tax=Candidatus Soleaferrea massiliensis TaxID=1470354 RepID=UPI000694764C|nr:Crp/Fnr family transcriptional regulator [Candidatus Soleaferrea massiliensis]
MASMDTNFLMEVLPFWKALSDADQQYLIQHTRVSDYPKGTRVHSGSAQCTGVLLVFTGQLRAYLLSEEGKEITLFRLLEQDSCLLSATCILKNISFDIFIDAECDTKLYVIEAYAFQTICRKYIEAETFSKENISSRFSDVMWVMEQTIFMKFDQRLAIFLLDQASLDGSDTIHLTHEQIARHMGSAREVVSRMLKYFQNEGLLQVSRGGIRLLDRKRLRDLT